MWFIQASRDRWSHLWFHGINPPFSWLFSSISLSSAPPLSISQNLAKIRQPCKPPHLSNSKVSLCVFHLRVSRCCLFILWSWECHETRSLFLSIWCLSWPQAWANVSGPSVIGTLGPKWRRATCLPAHFLSSAHTLGLAIAMPAHTHTVWCTQTHTDTEKKNAAGSTLYTVKHWNLHKHAMSQGVSMTELPTHSLLLYLCSHYAFQAIQITIQSSGPEITLMLKTNHDSECQHWIPSFFTFSLSLKCESLRACPFGSGWVSRSHCLLQIWHWPGTNRRYGELSPVGA